VAPQRASPVPGARWQCRRRPLFSVCASVAAEGGEGAASAEEGAEDFTVLGVKMNAKDAAMWQGRMYLVLVAAAYGTVCARDAMRVERRRADLS